MADNPSENKKTDEMIELLDQIRQELSFQLTSVVTTVDNLSGEVRLVNTNIRKLIDKQTEALEDAARQRAFDEQRRRSEQDDSQNTASRSPIREGVGKGLETGIGGILGGIGAGIGILSRFVGIGAGIASLGVGIGGFFAGISAADAAIEALGNGDNLKTLMINVGQGISSLDSTSLASFGALLGASALFSSVTPPSRQFRVATGMTMVGLGIGGFMAGLAAAGDITGFDGAVFATQAANLSAGAEAIGTLSEQALTTLAVIAGTGALMGATSVQIAGKAAVGMGLAGLGIGGFMAGIAAAGDITGFDGSTFAAQAQNVATGMNALGAMNTNAQLALVSLAGLGALAGAASISSAAFAASGMGIAGFGLGAFMTGMVAAGDITGFDGSTFAAQAQNIAAGLSAFSGAQLGGLSALMVTGGILGATGVGNVAAGGAALGMGLVGMGIGAFISGIATAGDLASWMGADGSGIKTIMENVAGGLTAFNTVDASNFSQIGAGMQDLGIGLVAFMGQNGLQAISDSAREAFNAVWAWFTGDENSSQNTSRFQTIVDELQVFNGVDFSGIQALRQAQLGPTLSELGESLRAFPDVRNIPSVALTNFIDGPINAILEMMADEDYNFNQDINDFATGMNTLSSSLERFAGLDLRGISAFSFEDFGRDLARGADAMNVALNGGIIRRGTNINVPIGLAEQQISAAQAADNIGLISSALRQLYERTETIATGGEGAGDGGGSSASVLAPVTPVTNNYYNTTNNYYTTTDTRESIDPAAPGPR